MKSSKIFGNPKITITKSDTNVALPRIANYTAYCYRIGGVPLLSHRCGTCGDTVLRVLIDSKPVFEDERNYISTYLRTYMLLYLPALFPDICKQNNELAALETELKHVEEFRKYSKGAVPWQRDVR